jgi:polyhydroxybutyrate depolymerase
MVGANGSSGDGDVGTVRAPYRRALGCSCFLACLSPWIVGASTGCATDAGVPGPGSTSTPSSGGIPGAANGGASTGGALAGLGGDPTIGTGGSIGGSAAAGGSMPSTGGTSSGGLGSAGVGAIAGAGGTGDTGGAGGAPSTGGTPGGGDCGTRAGMRGKTLRTITVGNTQRTFIAYLPQAANPATPLPFVYVFHGASQTGSELYDMTEYAKLADSEGIAVVFPDGQGASSASGTGVLAPWCVTDGPLVCGLGTLAGNPNPVDFAFMDAIKADVSQDQCLDSKHVFATGFSMGGYMSHHVACDRPDFRAAAPHSGGTMASLDTCKTGHMPIIIFHGGADLLIAAGCDDPNSAAQSGFPASATLWAQKNGCKATYTTLPETGTNGNDGQCYLYDGCPADGQVELCTFPTLAHAWAGAPVCAGCIGSGVGFPSATQLEWDFFKKYAW